MVELLHTVLVAILGFGIFLLAHVLIWAVRGSERCGFGLLATLWAQGLGCGVLVGWWWGLLFGVPAVIACSGMLMALYCHLYTGMLRSVSLRILGETARSGGLLGVAALEKRYQPREMLEHRLEWLELRGWTKSKAETHSLAKAGRRVLLIRRWLATWLLEGTSG